MPSLDESDPSYHEDSELLLVAETSCFFDESTSELCSSSFYQFMLTTCSKPFRKTLALYTHILQDEDLPGYLAELRLLKNKTRRSGYLPEHSNELCEMLRMMSLLHDRAKPFAGLIDLEACAKSFTDRIHTDGTLTDRRTNPRTDVIVPENDTDDSEELD